MTISLKLIKQGENQFDKKIDKKNSQRCNATQKEERKKCKEARKEKESKKTNLK